MNFLTEDSHTGAEIVTSVCNRGESVVHKKELERIHSILLENKRDLENEMKTLPEGRLYCLKKGERWFYYEILPKKGNRKKEKRRGITNDINKVFALVRKAYIGKALGRIEKNIGVLEMAIKHYSAYDEKTVMEQFLVKHPELSEGIYHGMQSDEAWADDYERQKNFYKEQLVRVSTKGIPMRSDGELYIASRLDHYGIPYRYEASVPHPDVSRIPDFTIRRPRDGKIIYWEHMGRTGDDDYMSGNELKRVEYENADIVPWDNLIITYNMKSGGFDARIIEAMIQGWLL